MADGASVYRRDDGVIIVRASAFGHCELQLWAAFDGVQPMEHKDVTKRAFSEGHLHEKAVTEQRTQEGFVIRGDQTEVELKILPGRLHIVGHIDGFIELGTADLFDEVEYGPERLWECKSMSRAAFDDWVEGRFDYRPGYAWQLSIYMLGTKKTGAHYDVKRRDDGFIDTWLVDEPPFSRKEIKARAEMLLEVFEAGEMPPCTGTGGAKWFCEYWFLHEEQEIAIDSIDTPVDNIPELDGLMADYYEAVETEKWAKKERDRLKKEIAKFRNGRDQFGTEMYEVKIVSVNRKNFDKAAATAELGEEVMNKYIKTSPVENWYINPRKG